MRRRLRIASVVGARPNFVKMAPVVRVLAERAERFEHVLVHTGQHYDEAMSAVFFDELGIDEPSYHLGVGSGSRAEQVSGAIARLEPVLAEVQPDLVLVAGDVNSTLAGALAAEFSGIGVGHVEAGLRSFDRSMPEEVNRTVVDTVSRLLFIHSPEARSNLLGEGKDERSIHDVGNTMIDTLVALRSRIEAADAPARHGIEARSYLLVTLHRPALVDDPELLGAAIRELDAVAATMPVVFPAHPRTARAIAQLEVAPERVRVVEPLGYVEFLSLLASAAAVLTDSGGIQEETTFLGVPCFTLRANTERPITVEVGTNILLGLDPQRIGEIPQLLATRAVTEPRIPPLWDGRAAERIADVLELTLPA